MNLLTLTVDSNGNGKSMRRSATVEKDEPVVVKLTACAKLNGKNRPKNERMLTAATAAALP
jgi:hypothetical protein